jgi:Flp pilus assembly protein TadD
MHASLRLAFFAITLASVRTAAAQRNTDSTTSAGSPRAVRAELAAVLLQSKKYGQAAMEYRSLLTGDPANADYRLQLARALAWGDRPREAERELRTLRLRNPQNPAVDSLLHLVRDAMEPTSIEAGGWVVEQPNYAPYRLAYARALAREHYLWVASAQFDTLLQRPGSGTIPDATALRREQAEVFIDARDVAAGTAGLRSVLRATPKDTSVRHQLAVLLGDWRPAEAVIQYDTLLIQAPTGALFLERARLRFVVGDSTGAETDLHASLKRGASVEAYMLLGDRYRERGDFDTARQMYEGARDKVDADRGDGTSVSAAIAQLAREERPVVAFAPLAENPQWRLITEGVSDNLGVHYLASTVQGALPLGDGGSLGVAVMHQYLGERSSLRSIDLNSVGGVGSLGGQVIYGPFLGQANIGGGALQPPGASPILLGTATAAAWISAWELAFDALQWPAYPSLMTTTALRPPPDSGGGDPLVERSLGATLGGPIGDMDLAATAQQSHLSDGNTRMTIQGYLRYPLSPGVYAVYSGSRLTFSQRSTRYWDPFDYIEQGAGLEFAMRTPHGLSWSLAALPGWAWSKELYRPPTDSIVSQRDQFAQPEIVHHSAFQLGGSGELAWRNAGWEGSVAVTYGQGRAGGYQRLGLTIGARAFR